MCEGSVVMSKAFSIIAASLLMLTLSELSALAVCVCVRGTLKVTEIRGQVVATSKLRPSVEEPMSNASVKVLKCYAGECQTVAESTTDERGRFTIEGVKPGKYELEASATHFQRVVVGLKVSGGSGGKKKEIVMALEPGMDCCAGRAEVRNLK
jgi:hypothetical protein